MPASRDRRLLAGLRQVLSTKTGAGHEAQQAGIGPEAEADNAAKQKRDAKHFNNRKEHDTKGKDTHARKSWS